MNLGVDANSCKKSLSSIKSKLKVEVKPDMEKAMTADAYRELLRKYAGWATQANGDVGPCTGVAIGKDETQDENFWHRAGLAVRWLTISAAMANIDSDKGWESSRNSLLSFIEQIDEPPPATLH